MLCSLSVIVVWVPVGVCLTPFMRLSVFCLTLSKNRSRSTWLNFYAENRNQMVA